MNNSQERKGPDLGDWVKGLSGYPPLETRTVTDPENDESHHRISVYVPPEIKVFIAQRARQLGLTRSHYIRLLVKADIERKS